MTSITPEIKLAMDRQMGERDPRDGKPFYCAACGLGWNEYGACEEMDCELESQEAAAQRHVPSVQIPEIVGFNVGDYSDIMDEPL
jgi:hypothetical protein